jgi:hypothetical protein
LTVMTSLCGRKPNPATVINSMSANFFMLSYSPLDL